MKNKIAAMAILGAISLGACTPTTKYSDCNIFPVDFGVTKSFYTKDDVNHYYISATGNDNERCDDGIILSPYFTMTINDVEVPVYGTRSANGVHCFSYVDIETLNPDLDVDLKVVVTGLGLKKKFSKVDVLPLSTGVEATFEEKIVTANIHKTGDYTFVFDGKQNEALTLMITEKIDVEDVAGEKQITYVEPGDYYDLNNLSVKENEVLVLKKGIHQIGSINLNNNSTLFMESGAYLNLYPDAKSPIRASDKENVSVYGHGLLDFSNCSGSSLCNAARENVGKGGLAFNGCNNVHLQGYMLINAQTWQNCLTDSKNIYIRDLMFYGYRTYADGIMLSDCKDALVEHNFIRTGDDAFETKSTSSNGLTERVSFQYNTAWTDKAVAYGCIYESNHDTSGVTFLHNSVGFANGSWSDHLGCCVVQMGNRQGAKMYDIIFDDIEIYYSINKAICNIYIGGSGGQGAGYGIVNNITFKNITCRRNVGYCLNLQTYDSENCKISKVICENIVSNNILFTKDNIDDYLDVSKYKGGYNLSNLTINGERCA